MRLADGASKAVAGRGGRGVAGPHGREGFRDRREERGRYLDSAEVVDEDGAQLRCQPGEARGRGSEVVEVGFRELSVDRPGVDRVGAEEEPGVGVEQADAVDRMAGGVEDLEGAATKVDAVAVGEGAGGAARGDPPGGGVEAGGERARVAVRGQEVEEVDVERAILRRGGEQTERVVDVVGEEVGCDARLERGGADRG